jgi:hypothetical protein
VATQIFVNLPVTDLARSIAFYEAVGFTPDPHMRSEEACGMKVSDDIWVMLLTQPFFERFTDKPVADASATTEVITAISAESPQAVDDMAERAVAAGGRPHQYAMDVEGMHGRAFIDPDGHQWEVLHTDPALFGG